MTDFKNYHFMQDFISQEYGTPLFSNDNFSVWEYPITLYTSPPRVRIFDHNLKVEFIDKLIEIGDELKYVIEFFEDAIEGVKCDCCDSPVTIFHEGEEVYSEFSRYFNEKEDLDGVLILEDVHGFKHQLFLGDAKRGATTSQKTLLDKSYRNKKNYQRSKKRNRAIGSR